MLKRIICALLCLIFAFFLIGCGGPAISHVEEPKPTSMFIAVERNSSNAFWVVYHRDTKVMYVISAGGYNAGNFTVLVNPDGSPMIWEGD